MPRQGATHHFVSTVDDIAWLLNLRGADVSYNPVFLAHAADRRATAATLFVGAAKVGTELRARARRRRRAPRALRAGRRRARRRCRPSAALLARSAAA